MLTRPALCGWSSLLIHTVSFVSIWSSDLHNVFIVSLIESKKPVIIGEAPPSTWEHSCAHRMFADRHTDYSGPQRVETSVAQTRVKKGK
ncbi:hypothetical protein F4604DRAFT_1574142, partial [Suillus subluteus]